ncbi:MAG: DNA-binding protein [Verrucomicrobia bacterium]|nr:MAG: DNA-binding protein [Verrucomicrobiota bacterium]
MICLRAFDPTMASNRKLATRNLPRFPGDFGFQLTAGELRNLRSQIATSSLHGGRRYRPWAFTEHGAIMLGSVLNSEIAVQASIRVVRAFVRLREMVAANAQLAAKLKELEQRLDSHDEAIANVFAAIKQLLGPPEPPKKREIGFHVREQPGRYRAKRRF